MLTSQDIETLLKSLKSNGFEATFVPDAETAARLVLDTIPPGATVGAAGSVTIRQIGILNRLKEHGTELFASFPPNEASPALARQMLQSDVLLASSNAVTLDGKLVNIDGTGNRVAGMVFGPRKVILVIGLNKVVRHVDEAIHRIKHVIAPYHARAKKKKTPCAVKGSCTDCKSPERICNVTTIIERRPSATGYNIILVGEDLGLGWDPAWPVERRERIALAYRKTREGFPQTARTVVL